MPSPAGEIHATLGAIWRLESGRMIAAVMRLVRDLSLAEELVQDACLVSLEKWGKDGIPPNPAGWLMTTARNRAIDYLLTGE